MFPMPKAAIAVNSANTTPAHFILSPCSRAHMGPPSIVPSDVLTLYLTPSRASEYFVAMPKTPVSHVQRTAPGPPSATAVATPMILPVPIVAANAVVSAPNWLTSPSPSLDLPREIFIPNGTNRWMKRRRNVRKMCVPNRRTSMGGPQR